MKDLSCFFLFMSALCGIIFSFLREIETTKAYASIFLLLSGVWLLIWMCLFPFTKENEEKEIDIC